MALPFAFTMLVAPGCGAQEGPANHLLLAAAAGPDTGGMLVAFAPTDPTFQAEQAHVVTGPNVTAYEVLVDGELATLDDGSGHASAVTVTEGGVSGRGYLNAGPHHFTIRAAGGPPAFEGDGQVPGGGTVRLFLFGPLAALQGRFVSTPDVPATGNEHVTAINLVRGGQTIEVVSCPDASCTPLSDPLALGDVFDTERPAGDDVGFRLIPSTALPDPPVLAFSPELPDILVAAPVYVSDEGQLQYGFN
jgi:hypothetical protein